MFDFVIDYNVKCKFSIILGKNFKNLQVTYGDQHWTPLDEIYAET